jgi:predicted membrane-bound spermidine synthase
MATTTRTDSTENKNVNAPAANSAPAQPVIAEGAARRAAWALYLIVVVSGAVLMGVEIAGAKILAPGFGTSTYVWGSIIGLFMGALAAGYFIGGWLSDRAPNFTILAMIVSVAGTWVLLIPRMGPQISDLVARSNWGTVAGPLLAATAIFFFPSFLMGMVSPFAVKLRARSLSALGSVAGNLYALSTFGSIVGTLLTTFVLIPIKPLSWVMMFLGLMLIVVAIVSLTLFRFALGGLQRDDRRSLSVMVLMALAFGEAWIVFPVQPHIPDGERLLKYEDSAYHEILVTESVMERDGEGGVIFPVKVWKPEEEIMWLGYQGIARWLKFNENTESGIFPYRPTYTNAVGYTDLLHIPLLFVNDPPPKRMLVVGGGGGIVPTQYRNAYHTEVDIAEIDDKVREISQEFFSVATSPNSVNETPAPHFYIGDGRQSLKKLPDNAYDVIVLDAYSSGGQVPFHLMTWEFMSEIKKKLTKRGVLATNIISALKNGSDTNGIKPAALFLAEYKTLTASEAEAKPGATDTTPLFKKDQVYVFQKFRPGFEDYRNVIIVCTQEDSPRELEKLMSDVKRLTTGSDPLVKVPHLDTLVFQGLYDKVEPAELEQTPILSDDYAPVDTMYRPVRIDETQGHY